MFIMRKLINPYRKIKGYNCFACSPDNNNGLKMEFWENGDEIYCEWDAASHFQGYINILHGGIQSSLMDEIASWVVLVKLKTAGVTTRIDVRLKKPVRMDCGKIKLKAKLIEIQKKIAKISVHLCDAEDNICAVGDIYYYIFPKDIAIEKYCFPENLNSFYED